MRQTREGERRTFGVGREEMGKTKITRKKKGRPSKADLGRLSGLRQSLPDKTPESELRRSLRRRNPTYHDDFYEDDEEEDDEDERREKKLKLVLKLPHKADFGGGDGGSGGVDSSPSQTRTEGNVAHASTAAVSASSSEYGDGNKPFKKRKIDGNDGVYDDGECDDGDLDEEDDARSIGSDHRKKERRRNSDTKGMDSAPGTPSGSTASLPLPDKKSVELILDKLQKKDTYGVYAEPVDPEELPDYHDVIDHPMDFGTVRKKLANGDYSTLEQFESDIFLICTNAMQYNAPETIYFKQARSIQELAKKKFQRLRIGIERAEKELKLDQKTKSNSAMKKPIKKSSCRTAQEPVGSDFSSGATLATTGDTGTWSNVIQAGGCERSNNTDGPVDGNSSLIDNKPEKTEEQLSWKGLPSKYGRKPFVVDENRRATYNLSNQPVVRMDSTFTTFEGESKQMVAVGLHADHSYARSLARFAATLGPVAWKVASRKIEQSLPAGMKFGRGWVGEYEPLPTPVLMLDRNMRKEPDCAANLNCTADSRKEEKAEGLKAVQDDANLGFKTLNSAEMTTSSKTTEPAKVSSVSRPNLDGKLFSVSGTRSIIGATCQQQKPVTTAKSDGNVFKKAESNSSSASGNPCEIAARKQFDYGSEMTTSRLLDMVSRHRNIVQSVPPKQKEANGVADGGLPTGKAVSGSLDGNKVNGSFSDSVSSQHSRAETYFPHGNQESFSDPVLLMRMLAEKTQNQQKSLNCTSVGAQQVMPSIPSLRRDDSNTAAITAARTWMSIGTAEFKSTDNIDPSKMQIAAASLYNPAREHPPISRFCEESPRSGGLQLQQEKKMFPPQAFLPHPVRSGEESRSQNNRPVIFPQLATTDLSRFQVQSPWHGLVPHTRPKQIQDMLPPDLNIGFQSSGSPVRQSSGILVDSQQPDLALQL
ncbi:uncharacterized protein LOC122640058 isoform X2 [Telopea speciosissima]|uniref:uncharacterized protein LOC122640058 isoform X2 n=1 Tax=Telopea speciosissima TaxID=54955 RepID=UPI001CC56886|nr:uncharacterized protein LOC122640058 isoform X2 [Telopea speciosissima]